MRLLREYYQEGRNIMELLRGGEPGPVTDPAAVLAAYDLQAGSYVEAALDPARRPALLAYAAAVAGLLDELGARSFLEAGVGEATTLAHVVGQGGSGRAPAAAGLDISWSRLAHGIRYARSQGASVSLVLGDLFRIPAADDAFDVVYTSHSIEPNRGREAEALRELHRVARRHVVLLEPASALGGRETRARIERHRYCTDLSGHARALGFRIVQHRLFDVCTRPDNETELIVLEKSAAAAPSAALPGFACPACRSRLEAARGHHFCRECCLIYPVIDGIPCLLASASILGSSYLEMPA